MSSVAPGLLIPSGRRPAAEPCARSSDVRSVGAGGPGLTVLAAVAGRNVVHAAASGDLPLGGVAPARVVGLWAVAAGVSSAALVAGRLAIIHAG